LDEINEYDFYIDATNYLRAISVANPDRVLPPRHMIRDAIINILLVKRELTNDTPAELCAIGYARSDEDTRQLYNYRDWVPAIAVMFCHYANGLGRPGTLARMLARFAGAWVVASHACNTAELPTTWDFQPREFTSESFAQRVSNMSGDDRTEFALHILDEHCRGVDADRRKHAVANRLKIPLRVETQEQPLDEVDIAQLAAAIAHRLPNEDITTVAADMLLKLRDILRDRLETDAPILSTAAAFALQLAVTDEFTPEEQESLVNLNEAIATVLGEPTSAPACCTITLDSGTEVEVRFAAVSYGWQNATFPLLVQHAAENEGDTSLVLPTAWTTMPMMLVLDPQTPMENGTPATITIDASEARKVGLAKAPAVFLASDHVIAQEFRHSIQQAIDNNDIDDTVAMPTDAAGISTVGAPPLPASGEMVAWNIAGGENLGLGGKEAFGNDGVDDNAGIVESAEDEDDTTEDEDEDDE
jgi:hypothetical protein